MKLLGIVACVACAALAAGSYSTPSTGRQDIYDPKQWRVMRSTTASFGTGLDDVDVQLLRTIEQRIHGGTGSPLYSVVNLIVFTAGHLIYQFVPLNLSAPFEEPHPLIGYTDDVLELRDVTGDHIPEIIFHAGDRSASGFMSDVHVLQYRPATHQFVDIRGPGFSESDWDHFRWFEFHGRSLAIVADPIEPRLDLTWKGSPSNPSAKFHQYVVFGWNPKHQAFRVILTIPSTHQEHAYGIDPFALDETYILQKLEEHHKHRR